MEKTLATIVVTNNISSMFFHDKVLRQYRLTFGKDLNPRNVCLTFPSIVANAMAKIINKIITIKIYGN